MSERNGDRRHARRVLVACEAHAYGMGERLRNPHLTDLSTEGAFLETPSEVPVGTVVLLKFTADGVDLKLESEVAHAEPPRGLGVRFVNLTPLQLAGLQRVVVAAEEGR